MQTHRGEGRCKWGFLEFKLYYYDEENTVPSKFFYHVPVRFIYLLICLFFPFEQTSIHSTHSSFPLSVSQMTSEKVELDKHTLGTQCVPSTDWGGSKNQVQKGIQKIGGAVKPGGGGGWGWGGRRGKERKKASSFPGFITCFQLICMPYQFCYPEYLSRCMVTMETRACSQKPDSIYLKPVNPPPHTHTHL